MSIYGGKVKTCFSSQNFELDLIQSICIQNMVAENMISVILQVENSVGKEENSVYRHYLLFSYVQKSSYLEVVKMLNGERLFA